MQRTGRSCPESLTPAWALEASQVSTQGTPDSKALLCRLATAMSQFCPHRTGENGEPRNSLTAGAAQWVSRSRGSLGTFPKRNLTHHPLRTQPVTQRLSTAVQGPRPSSPASGLMPVSVTFHFLILKPSKVSKGH